MPPKGKKKRASLHLDTASGQIKEAETSTDISPEADLKDSASSPARQVVEVVSDEQLPEAIETIKEEAEEIEKAAETIGEKIDEIQTPEAVPTTVVEVPARGMHEDVAEDTTKGSVESLFAKATSPTPSVAPEITVVGKRGTPVGVWVGAMLGIVLAIGVSLILLVRGPSHLSFLSPKPTPTPTQAPTPIPTIASVVNRKDVKVSVLNGGGVAGAGTKMKVFLENKGYTVTSVGNADAYTFDQTEVHVKSGSDAIASLLKDDLKSDYTVASSTGTVDTSAAYDAQVIVGK